MLGCSRVVAGEEIGRFVAGVNRLLVGIWVVRFPNGLLFGGECGFSGVWRGEVSMGIGELGFPFLLVDRLVLLLVFTIVCEGVWMGGE